MAVNYQAPAPVANEATMSGLLARMNDPRYRAATSGRGGGGGGGGGSPGGWGSVVQLRDSGAELQNQLTLGAMQAANQAGGIATQAGMQAQRLNVGAQMQEREAQLRAWQFEQQVTTQEAAKMRADQRAMQAIQNRSDLSKPEQLDLTFELQTGIDMTAKRMQRDAQKAQLEQMQQATQHQKLQAEWQESRLRFAAQDAEGKLAIVVDADARPGIEEDLLRERPDWKTADPEGFEKAVKSQAVRQMTYTQVASKPDGTLDWTAARRAGEQAGGRGSSGRSAGSGDGLGAKDYYNLEKDAIELAQKEATAKGGEVTDALISKYKKQLQGGIEAFRQTTPAGQQAAAKTEQEKTVQTLEAELNELAPKLSSIAPGTGPMPPTPAEQIQYGIAQDRAKITMELIRLFRAFPDPFRMPDSTRKKISALKESLEMIKQSEQQQAALMEKSPKPAASAATPPAEPHKYGTRLRDDAGNILNSAGFLMRHQQKMLGDVARGAADKAKDFYDYLTD